MASMVGYNGEQVFIMNVSSFIYDHDSCKPGCLERMIPFTMNRLESNLVNL
jgi:hypothetical protein